MELVKDTCKIWEYMYAVSRDYLYQGISKKEFLEISISDKLYLETVYYMENPKISEIAEKLHHTNTAITNMTKKLEKKGYVKRIKSEVDKREVRVELSKKGNYLFLWKEEMHIITVKEIKEILNPEEFENFKYLLGKISNDFENKLDIIYDQNKNINKSDWPPIV